MTAKGNYTEKDAADLITQLLEGVSYLHSQGLCPLWICLQQPFMQVYASGWKHIISCWPCCNASSSHVSCREGCFIRSVHGLLCFAPACNVSLHTAGPVCSSTHPRPSSLLHFAVRPYRHYVLGQCGKASSSLLHLTGLLAGNGPCSSMNATPSF